MDLPSFEFGSVHLKFMGFQLGSSKIAVITVKNQPRLQRLCRLAQVSTGGSLTGSAD
jgi:hypothetical protein